MAWPCSQERAVSARLVLNADFEAVRFQLFVDFDDGAFFERQAGFFPDFRDGVFDAFDEFCGFFLFAARCAEGPDFFGLGLNCGQHERGDEFFPFRFARLFGSGFRFDFRFGFLPTLFADRVALFDEFRFAQRRSALRGFIIAFGAFFAVGAFTAVSAFTAVGAFTAIGAFTSGVAAIAGAGAIAAAAAAAAPRDRDDRHEAKEYQEGPPVHT